MLALISFINPCCNFDLNLLSFIVSVAISIAGSGVGSRVAILFKIYVGNNLLLKLLWDFSLALNNSSKCYVKNNLFQMLFYLFYLKFFNLAAKLFCLSPASSNVKCPPCMFLKKAIDKEYSLKL